MKSNSLEDAPTRNGQFVLAVDHSQNNPDDLFEQAQSAEEAGNIAEAERLYCILMKSDSTDASAPFNLGNLLRAPARSVEAEAALRTATRVDPTFAEAWYNLSDLLDEQGRVEAAIECLRTALRVAPDYADATFNLGLLLQRTNQYAEAADYWRSILSVMGIRIGLPGRADRWNSVRYRSGRRLSANPLRAGVQILILTKVVDKNNTPQAFPSYHIGEHQSYN